MKSENTLKKYLPRIRTSNRNWSIHNQGICNSIERYQIKKADGLDEIPNEVWKMGLFNTYLIVYNQSTIDEWRNGCILPFPKNGDLSKQENYRGITLTCISAKIYNTMLRNWIQPEIYKLLRLNQNSFRNNRSRTGQILTVRRIIEGVKEKNIEACIIFVDLSKAFDSIDRDSMYEILKAYGIPIVIIKAIMMLYTNITSLVRYTDGYTEFFDINGLWGKGWKIN